MKRAFFAGFVVAILCFSMLGVFTKTGLVNAELSPVISSVSPISPARLQTIIIQGSGFGDIQPQLLNLGDGSVDTVWGGSTPSIVVYDERNLLSAGAAGNWSGFTNGPPDLIGIVLVSWTNSQIVIGGFGSGLGSQFSWTQVLQGDPLQIQIQNVDGVATYNTIAVSNQPNQTTVTDSSTSSNSNTTLPVPSKPDLAVSCQSSTTTSNFRVEITGNLTSNGTGLQGLPILLSYSVNEGKSWNELTSVGTDNYGNFLAVWLPSATGNYLLKAEWAGNTNYSETSTVITFVVLPFGEQSVFSVTSNSIISALAFNSTSGQLDFTISGSEGTSGYCKVYIPTSLISDAFALNIFLDGNPISYNIESSRNSWLVSFNYHHSVHEVTMEMKTADLAAVNGNQFNQWFPYGVITVLIAVIAVLLASRKTKKTASPWELQCAMSDGL